VTVTGLKENVTPFAGRPLSSVKQHVERVTVPEYPFMLVTATGILAVTGITF
jgi:hypothetical protein